ncbi:hypothetical protein UQW22_10035 [Isoptericola halotolerans]|uniref:hypothetical protein n=1 Tax=Isoptericola halotolerans TaxID=300560 RepID=UPI0038910B55
MSAILTSRSWEFDAPRGAAPIVTRHGNGFITIEPLRLFVSRHMKWGLHIQVEGRWVLKSGEYGHRLNSAVYNESNLTEAPAWVREAAVGVAR